MGSKLSDIGEVFYGSDDRDRESVVCGATNICRPVGMNVSGMFVPDPASRKTGWDVLPEAN